MNQHPQKMFPRSFWGVYVSYTIFLNKASYVLGYTWIFRHPPDRILFHKLLHELKCWFLICLLGNSFFSSIEVTDFSSQLYLILAKIKTKNWDLNVCDVIIVTVREKVPTHLVIFHIGHYHSKLTLWLLPCFLIIFCNLEQE